MGTFSTHPRMESSPVPGWRELGQLQVTSGNEKLVAGKQAGPGDEGQRTRQIRLGSRNEDRRELGKRVMGDTGVLGQLKTRAGTSLVVQWLRLHAPTAGGAGLIPGQGTKIPHAAQ